MKKKNFLYGVILLGLSALVAKVLGALYRIPLTNLLGAEGLGLYQMIVSTYAMVLVITSSGMPVVVSRMISQQTVSNNWQTKKKILKSAVLVMGFIGLLASMFVFLLSGTIASLQGNQLASIGYLAVAPAILLEGLLAVLRGYFEGLQNMKPTAISEILEQIVKVLFGLFFANLLLPMGIEYGVLGAIIGIALGDLIALGFVFFLYLLFSRRITAQPLQIKNSEETAPIVGIDNIESLSLRTLSRKMFALSLPITLAGAILPFTIFIDSILIINLLTGTGFSTGVATSLFGLQSGVVNSLINVPMILAIALATAILPSIAASNTYKNKEEIAFKSAFALKLVWLIALPCFLGFLLLSGDITIFLYEQGLGASQLPQIEIASALLQIMSVCILYLSFLRVLVSLLHGLNKSNLVAKNLVLASFLKIILTLVLVSIPTFHIYGASVATALCYGFAAVLNLRVLKKTTNLKLELSSFFTKPLLASGVMVITIFAGKMILPSLFSQKIATVIIIMGAAVSYLIMVAFLGVFTKEERAHLPSFSRFSNVRKIK